MEFMGYVRENGKVGARNHVAIIPSVNCANDVAKRINSAVANTRSLNHHQGCCQLPPDLDRVTLSLTGLGQSPNIGAVLIVSLGCEGTDVDYMAENIAKTGKPVEVIRIQELGGTRLATEKGIEIAQKLADKIAPYKRQPVDMSNCIMSIKCGASDATSGLASNCVIGYVADRIVDLGGTVVFGETTEFIGAEHILARRARTPEVGKKIYDIVNRMEARAKSLGCDMRKGQPTPGNIAGGLSSIEEKSLGAIMKSGSRTIEGVLEYTDVITDQKGLWIKDTPGREIEILTGMAITGSQAMCFSTGRGAPQGFPTMPVLKICGNPVTFQHLQEDMDVNAGLIITGEKSIDQVGEEAFRRFVGVLSGEKTHCEELEYYNSIDIYTMGPVI
jgi:altronate dehydratase large subunit